MIDYKQKYNLAGNNLWPHIASVYVKGIPNEPDINHNELSDENEKIIYSWKNVVVLKATSDHPTPFFVGFSHEKAMKYLDLELTTDTSFALRIGVNDIRFFVIPKSNLSEKINLEVVEITTEDNPKYADVTLL